MLDISLRNSQRSGADKEEKVTNTRKKLYTFNLRETKYFPTLKSYRHLNMSRTEAQNPYVLPLEQMGFCVNVTRQFQREVTLERSFEPQGSLPTQLSSVRSEGDVTTDAARHSAADSGLGNTRST